MGDSKTRDAEHGALRIKTLRLAVRPGASAINQLASAIMKGTRSCSRRMSVAGFFFPYFPGFPVMAYPGRKSLPPAYLRKAASRG